MARTHDVWQTGVGATYIETIAPLGYDILIKGSDKYINFNTTVGSSGYGFRDNAGVMEVKSSGGAWAAISSGSAASTLADISGYSTDATKSTYTMSAGIPVHFKSSDANTLLYLDETNERVGIGTATPRDKFEVVGGKARFAVGYGIVLDSYNTTFNNNYINFYDATEQSTIQGFNANPGIAIGYTVTTTNPGGANTTLSIKGANTASTGKVLILENSALSRLLTMQNNGSMFLPQAPTASANYGLVSLGSGAFDGSTSGFFTGSADGTLIAGNLASGSTSDLMNLQVGGMNRLVVSNAGVLKLSTPTAGGSTGSQANGIIFTREDIPTTYLNRITNSWSGGTDENSMNFYVAESGGATNQVMTLNGLKYVGIGMLKPTAKLDILGPTQTGSGAVSTFLSTQTSNATSGTLNSNSLVGTFASGAGSANFRGLAFTGTINNSGAQSGTFTDIFSNTTETALNSMTHNLMDLQVGGSSKFKVTSFGLATVESLTSNSSARTALFFPNAGAGISWNNNATIKAPGAGVITISNEGETDFARLQFGGTTSSFPALKRNATGLDVRLADDSAYAPLAMSQIELGHATDTTLSRSSAGVLAVEGVVIPSISSTNTLTNKRITPRVGTTTSSATPTINTDNYDMYTLTAQAVDITSFTTNLSGTPTDGQKLIIRITGTAARAITWGASFVASTVALPTTTVTTDMLTVGFIYDTVSAKWVCSAVA